MNFTADYVAARFAVRTASIGERRTAERAAATIARNAEKAGVRLDEGALDEQARQEIVAAAKRAGVYSKVGVYSADALAAIRQAR